MPGRRVEASRHAGSRHARAGWRALPAGAAAAAPELRPWLSARGSLSALLRAHGDALRVRRLRQRCARSDPTAAAPARATPRTWLREVVLELDGRALVWACSAAAPCCLRQAWRGLRHIAGRPLGDWLFACRDIRRGRLEVRRLARVHPLARRTRRALRGRAAGAPLPTPLWARRSAFVRHGECLWVTEVFLPEVTRLRRR